MRAAVERRGWVGLVGGEPGIGKTRLAAACVGQLAEDGFGFAWVSCPEGDSAPPFWVWDRLLDQLGAGDALRAEAGEADPELARFLLFDAVATAIRKAAADRPLLLVMDDLHWADPASRRLLAAIRGVLATLPVVALSATPASPRKRSGCYAPRAVWTPRLSCRPSCCRARCGPHWNGDWRGCRPRPPSCCGWPRCSVTSWIRRCSPR